MQHQIGAEHAGNRSARSDGWDLGGRIERGMREAGEHAAEEIEEREPPMPHGVFDIVAEDPEVEHVAEQMHEAAMQEHRREKCQPGRHGDEVRFPGAFRRVMVTGIMPRRNISSLPNSFPPSSWISQTKTQAAKHRHRHILEADPVSRVIVFERKEHGSVFLARHHLVAWIIPNVI